MNITKEQLADIIQLAKVMIDNHQEEVEGNPSIVKLVKDLDNLGYINDDVRAASALKTYLYNTNAVNLNHTQYLIMLGIAKNCWYFKRPLFNYSIRKFLNGNR